MAQTSDMITIETYVRSVDPLQSSREFLELMRSRRSIREFSGEPVAREVLLNAIATAASAPSGANCQPWFFALIQSPELKARIRDEAEEVEREFYQRRAPPRWLADLAPLGTGPEKPYLSEAPALIAVFVRRQSSDSTLAGACSYYPFESAGIAVGLLLASLHRVGLATLTHTPQPMSFLNRVLNLEQGLKPFLLVVTGYPKEPVIVPAIKRKEFTEICRVY